VPDRFTDAELDALLREVPLPDGFAQRLHDSLAPSDERLDKLLRAVAVPSLVLSRLKEVPADGDLDSALAEVPSSHALIYDLRRPTWGDRWRSISRGTGRLAMAASWFLALTVVLAGLGGLALQKALPPLDNPQEMVVIHEGPFSLAGSNERAPAALYLVGDPPQPSVAAEDHQGAVDAPTFDYGAPQPGPVGQWVNLVEGGLRPMDDAVLLRYGVLGAPSYADDRLPELVAPRLPRPTGIEPPPVRGYDRPFFLKHRVFPPISPRANLKLAVLDVPLVPFSDVLGRLERLLAEGKVPGAGEVRTEELLAAMDYQLPAAPAGKLAIRTAAGPSLFGGPEAGLLQVSVQAGSLNARPQPATHLVLAIDLSHSMAAAGRLEMLHTAIRRLLAQLGSRDRLSLVLFDEEVRCVVEAATRDDADSLRKLVGELAPRGGTNLAAGLQQAASLAMNDVAGAHAARRLVLITDSEPLLSPEAAAPVASMLSEAAEAGVRLDVLDVSFREQLHPLLTQWAAETEGDARRMADGRQLSKALVEALAGGEATVAHDARLTLRFNPKAVAAYRLVGHEANALADVSPAAVEAEIAAGEAATALVELWFTPEDLDDLGTAELTWNDPATGQSQTVRQRISRVQFASTPREMPPSLVQAALAAQVGEVLHGSHDVLRQAGLRPGSSRGLAGVIEAAESANLRVQERGDVERLLALVRELQRQGVR
jgi:hypothetical protein